MEILQHSLIFVQHLSPRISILRRTHVAACIGGLFLSSSGTSLQAPPQLIDRFARG